MVVLLTVTPAPWSNDSAAAEPVCDGGQIADQAAAGDIGAITSLIATMEAAWNRGDFRGYMTGFLNPGVVFVSRGHIQSGWQGTLDHYVRDYGASEAARGRLHFHDICVELLAPDAAQLVSHFDLVHPDRTEHGVNTRLMRKVGGQWVIALNHVSTEEPRP